MIFDTSFLIDLMEREEKAVDKLKELEKQGEPLFTTAPTIFELHSGIARSKRTDEEKQKIMKVLLDKVILHFNTESAEKAGFIDGSLIKEGKRIGTVDSMICGIALVKNEKILTRNVKDFSKVKGIKIEPY